MALRIVIVGPGRVGLACALRLAQNGAVVLGFIARDPQRAEAAISVLGQGRVLDWSALANAHVVLFAVGDADLPAACLAAADSGARRACSLWVHTSGRHDLSVFGEASALGIRRGALHPVLPFSSAAAGAAAMPGSPAVLLGEPRSFRLLRRLCALLQLEPIVADGGDRVLYHAACALAANGLTALYGECERVLAAAGGLSPGEQRRLLSALMGSALRECQTHGAAAALSGPVRRGDAATVFAHRQRLRTVGADVDADYCAVMRMALRLAREGRLDAAAAGAVGRALEPD